MCIVPIHSNRRLIVHYTTCISNDRVVCDQLSRVRSKARSFISFPLIDECLAHWRRTASRLCFIGCEFKPRSELRWSSSVVNALCIYLILHFGQVCVNLRVIAKFGIFICLFVIPKYNLKDYYL